MSKNVILVLIGILCMSYECDNDTAELLAEQDVLFLKVYENHAWGYQLNGWLIDNAGNIRRFSNSDNAEIEWKSMDPENFISEEDMYSNLLQTEVSEISIKLSELSRYYMMIPSAERGILTEGENLGADIGSISYYAFRYRPEQRKYKAVLLQQDGDWKIENTSPDAKRIREWMSDIEISLQID